MSLRSGRSNSLRTAANTTSSQESRSGRESKEKQIQQRKRVRVSDERNGLRSDNKVISANGGSIGDTIYPYGKLLFCCLLCETGARIAIVEYDSDINLRCLEVHWVTGYVTETTTLITVIIILYGELKCDRNGT